MKLLWSSIESPSRNWKTLFKALTLLEFLVKNGPERIVEETRDRSFTLRPLQDFHATEGTIDRGTGVREKSKSLIELLGSNDQIRTEREKARQLRHKFIGISNSGNGPTSGLGNSNDPYYNSGTYDRDDKRTSYSSSGIDSGGRGSRYNESSSDKDKDKDRYNSSRSSRFEDSSSTPVSRSTNKTAGSKGRYDDDDDDDDDEPVKPKSKTKGLSGKAEKSGKLSVSISKAKSGPSVDQSTVPPKSKSPKSKEPEVDLLGGLVSDVFSTPASPPPVPAPALFAPAPTFDAFNAAPPVILPSVTTFQGALEGAVGGFTQSSFDMTQIGHSLPTTQNFAQAPQYQQYQQQQYQQQQQQQQQYQMGGMQQQPLGMGMIQQLPMQSMGGQQGIGQHQMQPMAGVHPMGQVGMGQQGMGQQGMGMGTMGMNIGPSAPLSIAPTPASPAPAGSNVSGFIPSPRTMMQMQTGTSDPSRPTALFSQQGSVNSHITNANSSNAGAVSVPTALGAFGGLVDLGGIKKNEELKPASVSQSSAVQVHSCSFLLVLAIC